MIESVLPAPLAENPLAASEAPRLDGCRILVTGAGDGLGRATALACARQGATVVLLGKTPAKLERVYDAIEAAGGPRPALVPMNLAGASLKDYQELAQTLQDAQSGLGGLDMLLHCAAHFTGFVPLSQLDAKTWVETLQVNLTAPFALTQALLPLLAASPCGRVIFCTDRHGLEAHAYDGVYGIAKAALTQMMSIWSAELPADRSLRMCGYVPGPMRTCLRHRGFPGELDRETPPPEERVPALLQLLDPQTQIVSGKLYRSRE